MFRLICAALFLSTAMQLPVTAKGASVSAGNGDRQAYIVVLNEPPLASYDGSLIQTPGYGAGSVSFPATAVSHTGAGKLDVNSPESRQYLEFLDERFESFRGEALLTLGRPIKALHRYRNAVNGFATELSAAELRALQTMPGVKSIRYDEVQQLHSDSGPAWLGADNIYNGSAGFPASGGEGVVVGVFDTGINWDHPSFADPGEGIGSGWDHVNPYNSQLGLCVQSAVLCNDKLVGVYDFVEDNTGTAVVEENNNGKDNQGHGSNVASVVAGNPVNVNLNGVSTTMAGVAPHANIISYRVCFIGDVNDPDDNGCQSSAILAAIDQAIDDGVDVVNHSIGGGAHDPWLKSTTTYAFLNLWRAGTAVITSAGNSGPNAETVGSPANAPWMLAVGAATHDRVFASVVENLSGGNTTPPGTLVGASSGGGIGIRKIVHAKDYGNALCGTGTPELQPDCAGNTGATNPFAANTFNGEIVVCDRGDYGRVEKGKNVKLAGAGGYILANTASEGESIVADVHCLPATHIGNQDGNVLRAWLDSGVGHQGSISGFSVNHIPEAGDIVASFSSRGPNQSPADGIMKPEIIAPGVQILGASNQGNTTSILNGTSFASPHVAGAAALVKSVHPTWTPPMIASALVMTATPELAIDYDGSAVNTHEIGAGRPRLEQAVNAGLFLDVTWFQFNSASPLQRGDPRKLNLPGIIDYSCSNYCDFNRTVTDMAGGATWNASVEGLPGTVSVTVTPQNFALASNASQALAINVDLSMFEEVGKWIYGTVRLSSSGLPDAIMPLAIYASGGELPDAWIISSSEVSGWQQFPLDKLINLPDATFTSGGLVEPRVTIEDLPEDPSNDSPYDRSEGLMTVWHDVPAGSLWLHAETLASSSQDLDMFVGRDVNGDGRAQESEELCTSTSPIDIERCDLYAPEAGRYWIIVQNWTPGGALDEVTLKSFVVGSGPDQSLSATAAGIIPADDAFNVRLSWDNVSAVPGTQLVGAVGVGTNRDNPNNIGVIPITFNKTSVAPAETLVLMNGISRGVTVAAGGSHDRVVVDIPSGISSFTVAASSADDSQYQSLEMELYRMDFDAAFTSVPFAAAPDTSGSPLAAASGSVGNGPSVTVSNATPGRWYVVLKNTSGDPADLAVRADMNFAGTPFSLQGGLWQPSSRPDLSQGFDYVSTGGYRGFLWYTYDEDGNPAWYLAAAPEPNGNVWVADLLRFTNDGELQKETTVGQVSVTLLAEQDSVFSFVLFGEEGSDRMQPSSPPLCPEVDGVKKSYTGTWSRPAVGVGGTTVLMNATSQGYLHYIYDDKGQPVWLLASDATDNLPFERDMPLLQFSGYCAVCTGSSPTFQEAGIFTRDYTDEDSVSWNLNYALMAPLAGSVDRTDDADKLTPPLLCQ